MALVDGVMVAVAPPDGYKVNFENPQRQGVEVGIWLIGVGLVIAFLFLIQRLYTKLTISRVFELDDALCLASWALSVALQGMIWHMYTTKLVGIHIWEMPITDLNQFLLFLTVAAALFCPASACAKLSLLHFYHRMTASTWFVWATRITAIIVIGSYTGIFFSLLFGCRPISASWDVTLATSAVCVDRSGLFIATAVVGCVSDLLVIILPIPIIARLKIPGRQRLGLLIIFSVGTLTLVTSLVRFGMLFYITSSVDQPWAIALAVPTINVEANLLVVCASMTTIPRFLTRVAPRLLGDTSSSFQAGAVNNFGTPGRTPGLNGSLRTWGAGSTNKRKYNKFGDIEYGLDTIQNGLDNTATNGNPISSKSTFSGLNNIASVDHVTGSDVGWDNRSSHGDGDSETAIVQTKTKATSSKSIDSSSD